MLSLKLFADEETLGALNIYSKTIDAFDDRAVALGNALAAHAAVAMEAAEEQMQVEHLETALVNARTIGAAVGIMMVTTNVDRERAFRILSSASQRLNVKLHILAGRIVATQETNTGPSR